MESSDRLSVEQEENVFRLLYKEVKPEDAGTYECRLQNKAGQVSTSATLLVDEGRYMYDGLHREKTLEHALCFLSAAWA